MPQPTAPATPPILEVPDVQPPELRGGRLWLFRALAVSLAPLLLIVLELALRVADYGHTTDFLVPVEGHSGVWTTNQTFGWRFFPKRIARAPVPFELASDKEDTYRIFVIGGSAARGTPDSAYSFGRMLEAMLNEGHPKTRFEVHNAAMTAINSHVARVIVDDCAPHQGDLFIIYLGNNEVVGPYGAGTVFGAETVFGTNTRLGAFTPNLATIRASIALQATRTGQLLARSLAANSRPTLGEWRGMEMFLEQRVAADDPRLPTVYEHFRHNLADMINTIHGTGAETLLVTVASNLRDQPPFASSHRAGLSTEDEARWIEHYRTGRQAMEADDHETALTEWQQAAEIDDRYAELRFQMGHAYLTLGDAERSKAHLRAARDLDTLRFRADSMINQTIRQVATAHPEHGVSLLDMAGALIDGTFVEDTFVEGPFVEGTFVDDAASDKAEGFPGMPGNRFFHEHVHFNFAGNFALASAVYRHLEPHFSTQDASPSNLDAAVPPLPLNQQRLADRLAFTPFDEIELERDILRLVSRPPFVDQIDHHPDLNRRWLRVRELHAKLTPTSWQDAETLYEQRLSEQPNDLEARRRLATHLQTRRPAASIPHWRFLLDRLPDLSRWRVAFALALADAGQAEEALTELERLPPGDRDSADGLVNRGTILEARGDQDAADAAYRQALTLDPRHTLASFNLASSTLRRGQLARSTELFQALVEGAKDFAPAHHGLGRSLELQGDVRSAITAYRAALRADPGLASAYNSLGLALQARGDFSDAARAFRQALTYRHDFALAMFNLADLRWSLGFHTEAATLYARGLSYRPDNVQARYNRAGALMAAGDEAAALAELELVIGVRADPGSLHNLAWILATSDRPELRDPARAITLAERAARGTNNQSAEILETLAVAYQAAGRTHDARATLNTALSLAHDRQQNALATRLQQRLDDLR